ncbi:MAG: DUF2484 family protein [Paracoccaceae bacterium]
MSLSYILGSVWPVIATITALLPMRRQIIPGAPLLLSAPFLLIFIGFQHGFWIAGLGLLAFLSMFRNPVIYLYRKARGLPAELPKELQGDRK